VVLINRILQNLSLKKRDSLSEVGGHSNLSENRELILSIAAGRSGQNWMTSIFTSHSNCSGGCHRMIGFEELYRYITWYQLPVDLEAFYDAVQSLIIKDWSQSSLSIYSSPFFAFGLDELVNRFNPDYCFFHIRDPESVINSNFVKGWYSKIPSKRPKLIPGPQPLLTETLNHNLGRIMPKDDYYDEWEKLTQIGRITWYYVTINSYLYEKYKTIPESKKWFFKLSEIDQNYDYYREVLTEKFNLSPILKKNHFLALKSKMKNKGKSRRLTSDWSDKDKRDYNNIIEPFMHIYDSLKTSGF